MTSHIILTHTQKWDIVDAICDNNNNELIEKYLADGNENKIYPYQVCPTLSHPFFLGFFLKRDADCWQRDKKVFFSFLDGEIAWRNERFFSFRSRCVPRECDVDEKRYETNITLIEECGGTLANCYIRLALSTQTKTRYICFWSRSSRHSRNDNRLVYSFVWRCWCVFCLSSEGKEDEKKIKQRYSFIVLFFAKEKQVTIGNCSNDTWKTYKHTHSPTPQKGMLLSYLHMQ